MPQDIIPESGTKFHTKVTIKNLNKNYLLINTKLNDVLPGKLMK